MKTLQSVTFLLLLFFVAACNEDEPKEDMFQSDRYNMGRLTTLTLSIPGVGIYNFQESANALSYATDTEGS